MLQAPVVQIEDTERDLSHGDRHNRSVREVAPQERMARPDAQVVEESDSQRMKRDAAQARDVRLLKPQKIWRSLPRAHAKSPSHTNVTLKNGLSVVEYDVDASVLSKGAHPSDHHQGKAGFRLLRGGASHALRGKGKSGMFGANALSALGAKKSKLNTKKKTKKALNAHAKKKKKNDPASPKK